MENSNFNIPKVSIIMPVYNSDKYLRQALDSVVNQTLKDIEIIIVNDGSTDKSLDIIQEYASKYSNIVIIDQVNGGVGNAINNGFKIARGEYLAEIDSDDYIKPEMYEELYERIKINDLDIVISNYYEFTGHGETFEAKLQNFFNTPEWYNKELYPYTFYNDKTSCDYLKGFAWSAVWTALYKREFLLENNIYWNENVRAYNDTGFWVQTRTLAKKIMHINKAYYFHRSDNSVSTVNNFEKFEQDFFGEHLFVKKFLIEKCLWNNLKEFYIKQIFCDCVNFALPKLPNNKIKQFVLKTSSILSECIIKDEDITSNIFNESEWKIFHQIINDPLIFARKYIVMQAYVKQKLIEAE